MRQYANEHTKKWSATIDALRRLHLRHPRVQPLHVGCPQERARLPLQRVEQQGRRRSSATAAWAARAPSSTCVSSLAELQIGTVRQQLAFSLMTDFENFSTFKPAEYHLPGRARHARPARVVGRSASHGSRARRRADRRVTATPRRGHLNPTAPGRVSTADVRDPNGIRRAGTPLARFETGSSQSGPAERRRTRPLGDLLHRHELLATASARDAERQDRADIACIELVLEDVGLDRVVSFVRRHRRMAVRDLGLSRCRRISPLSSASPLRSTPADSARRPAGRPA